MINNRLAKTWSRAAPCFAPIVLVHFAKAIFSIDTKQQRLYLWRHPWLVGQLEYLVNEHISFAHTEVDESKAMRWVETRVEIGTFRARAANHKRPCPSLKKKYF